MKQHKGFTIIELLVALTVIAVIAALATPSFKDSIDRNRTTSTLQDLGSSLKYARSEAVGRSSTVTICASSDQATCTGTWSQGWIVFQDIDYAGDFDVGTDELLRVHGAIPTGYTLTFPSTRVTYTSRGFTAGQSGSFVVCNADKADKKARGLILQGTGSLRFSVDTDANNIHEDAAGNDFDCN